MNELSKKDRMKIPRQPMPEQDPEQRRSNFKEVNLGFTEELAKMEALRCLQCPKPVCISGCPVGVKIDEFIKSTNPMKMYDYLACGKPVVTTRGAGVDMFEDYVYIADYYEQFNQFLDESLNSDTDELQQKRVNILNDHTWQKRVSKMMDIIKRS